MLDAAQAMWSELEQEAGATRRVLERVPADKLTWRPHPKSMTLGQLALHVAKVPGDLANLSKLEGIDAETVDFNPAQPAQAAEILPALRGEPRGRARDSVRARRDDGLAARGA